MAAAQKRNAMDVSGQLTYMNAWPRTQSPYRDALVNPNAIVNLCDRVYPAID